MDYVEYTARMKGHQAAIKEAATLLTNALESARTDAAPILKSALSGEIGHATQIVQAMEMDLLLPPPSYVP